MNLPNLPATPSPSLLNTSFTDTLNINPCFKGVRLNTHQKRRKKLKLINLYICSRWQHWTPLLTTRFLLSNLCLSGAMKILCPGRNSHKFSGSREWPDSWQVPRKSIISASRLRFSDFDAPSRRRRRGKRVNLRENLRKPNLSAYKDFCTTDVTERAAGEHKTLRSDAQC